VYYLVKPDYFTSEDLLVFLCGSSLTNFLNYTSYPCTVTMKETQQ